MKTKSMLFTAAIAIALTAAFVACDKNEDDEDQKKEQEKGEEGEGQTPTLKVEATQTNDTLRVAYDGTLDLSAIFSVKQAEGGTATLSYAVTQQPSYAENNAESYTPVENVYSVSGSTLTSAAVRVPDAIDFGEGRVRVVREGKLKISLAGADTTFIIIQTGKPALVPVISLGEELTDVEGGTLTLNTTGAHRLITASYFTISPIDFGTEDIRVGIGEGDYITMNNGGVPQAGGSSGSAGTGGFVVAYYRDTPFIGEILDDIKEEIAADVAAVLADETLPHAKLYVNVTYVAPNAVVGIVASDSVGLKSLASFWKTGQKASQNFVLAKLADETTRAYVSSEDGALLCGEFNANTKGAGSENGTHAGWYPNVNLNTSGSTVTGSALSWTITHSAHFKEDGWTVTINTNVLAADPQAK